MSDDTREPRTVPPYLVWVPNPARGRLRWVSEAH